MPWYSTCRNNLREWWTRRKMFEKIMMFLITVLLIPMSIVISEHNKTPPPLPPSCKSPLCLEEAARIKLSTAENIDPCSDIYSFTCGNFWQNVDEDEKEDLESVQWQQHDDIYNEPVHSNDHEVVKLAKKTYQSCMNDVEIERDHLTTIKKILSAVGGWPVVEGDKWDENKFDWMNTTFRLREMGYYYSQFLDLYVTDDPDNNDKYILQVTTADMFDYQYKLFYPNIEAMAKFAASIAQIFGAEEERAKEEMLDVLDAADDLYAIQHANYPDTVRRKFTIAQYLEQTSNTIDWLRFINKILEPKAPLTKDDVIFGILPEKMQRWLETIKQIPKRIQANYMIWKLLVETIPYLNCEMRISSGGLTKKIDRDTFCKGQVRFFVDPINIIAARKYLPAEEKKAVEEFLLNIKSELVRALPRVDWIVGEDKHTAIKKADQMTISVGPAIDYFDDTIFNDLLVDMIENEHNDTFLSLLAQSNRNYQSTLYKLLDFTKSESSLVKARQFVGAVPSYIEKFNIMYLPHVSAQRLLFNRKRPGYLNYGALGSFVGVHFVNAVTNSFESWGPDSMKALEKKLNCMSEEMHNFLKHGDTLEWESTYKMLLLDKTVGNKLVYEAYKKWVNQTGGELPLVAVDYTSNQLFWISAATAWCNPNLPSEINEVIEKDPDFLVKLIGVSFSNNHNFANDFNCPKNSRMNPSHRCTLF